LPDLQAALDWFTAERAALVAAIEVAAVQGFETQAWQLTWTLYDFLYRRGHWDQWAHTGEVAVAATARLDDPIAQARAHFLLSGAYNELRRLEEAEQHLHRVVELYREAGDLVGQGHAYNRLGFLSGLRDDHATGLGHAQKACDLYRAAAHDAGLASALNSVGWHLANLGAFDDALAPCEEGLRLSESVNDLIGEAMTADSLGYICHNLGRYAEAIAYYQRTLAFYRDFGDRSGEADALVKIGDGWLASGDATAAREAWQDALAIFSELEHPGADAVQAKLEALH
jgi:tetratricopeptide (TPR) repeat protein